jgi:SAM-dependent methyltransferase
VILNSCYLFKNPHRLCKKRGFVFGQTPLSVCDQIAKECRILSKDVLFDLGCGTGRPLFWLRSFIGCEVYGVDLIETFIENASRVKKLGRLDKIHFFQQDLQTLNFEKATVIYLYGTTFSDEMIVKIIDKLRVLPAKTKIITVSFPLQDFCEEELFEYKKSFLAKFPWGKTEIFLQTKK